MAYPTRGEWLFRNVTRSYYWHPTLDGLTVSETNAEDVATASFDLVDLDEDIVLAEEDEVWVSFAGERIIAGHVKTLTRTYRSAVGPRSYRLEVQDYTAKLDDSVIDHQKSRPAEDVADRVAWIMSFLNYPITTTGVSLPTFEVDRADFLGMTVREALDATADEARLHYYVDFDKDLHMARNEVITAPFSLDDEAPDYATSFPYWDWEQTSDTVELANAVYVQGEKLEAFVTDATSIATYGRQERSMQDDALRTSAAITKAGERALAENGYPLATGQFVCYEPGLRGGMTFDLNNAGWGVSVDGTYVITEVSIEAVDPHDALGQAYLKSTVTYANRRRARPYRHKVKKPSDADLAEGDAVSVDRWAYEFQTGRLGLAYAFHYESVPDETDFAGPGGPISNLVEQNSHPHNIPWTAGVCALGLGGWGGHQVREQWFEMTLGDLAGVVGLTFEVVIDVVEGFTTNLIYGIATSPPTDYAEADFDVVGTVPAEVGTWTGFIPASVLTPSSTVYLAFAAEWRCQSSGGSWICSNEEPDITDVVGNGLFLSGSAAIDTLTVHEAVIEGAGMTDWVSGEGLADGSNRTFELVDWNGSGKPQARVGAVVMGSPADFDYDPDALTVTFRVAPPEGSAVAFRYKV